MKSRNRSSRLSALVPISISLAFRPDSTMYFVVVVGVRYSSCITSLFYLLSMITCRYPYFSFTWVGIEEQCGLRVLLRDSTQWAWVVASTHNLKLWSWVQCSNQCARVPLHVLKHLQYTSAMHHELANFALQSIFCSIFHHLRLIQS